MDIISLVAHVYPINFAQKVVNLHDPKIFDPSSSLGRNKKIIPYLAGK